MPEPKKLVMPPEGYQPSKAEMEEGLDMPKMTKA